MNTEELKNTDETLSEDDLKLRRMLKNLESVSAPNDFDFRLKSRLANKQPDNVKSRFVWVYRFALPVLAIGILFAAFFVLSGDFWSKIDSARVPQVPEIKSSNFTANNNEIAESSPSIGETAVNSNQKIPGIPKNEIAQTNSKPRKNERETLVERNLQGNSKDFGVKEEKTQQPDFLVNTNSQIVKLPENNAVISVQNVLSQIGISVETKNGKLVVKSLTSNGIGKSSGVQEGDVIEAIDSQKTTSNTNFANKIEAKTIVVLRNNVRQTINLKN